MRKRRYKRKYFNSLTDMDELDLRRGLALRFGLGGNCLFSELSIWAELFESCLVSSDSCWVTKLALRAGLRDGCLTTELGLRGGGLGDCFLATEPDLRGGLRWTCCLATGTGSASWELCAIGVWVTAGERPAYISRSRRHTSDTHIKHCCTICCTYWSNHDIQEMVI